MDHRWGMRVAVDIGVQLLCRPRTIGVGRLVNVSVSGALVRSGFIPPLLARIRITGPLGEPAGVRWEAIEAYVVRHHHNGFGLEWAELAPVGICTLMVECKRARGHGLPSPRLICTRQDLPAKFRAGAALSGDGRRAAGGRSGNGDGERGQGH